MQRRQLIAASSLAAGALTLSSVMKAATAQTAPCLSKPIAISWHLQLADVQTLVRGYMPSSSQPNLAFMRVLKISPARARSIAIDAAAKSPADGYTLLITTSGTVWQSRVLYTKLPYNLDKDIVPVAFYPSG